MGPLLGGLAGFGWAMVPPFVLIFATWLYILRPHQWPQTGAEWLSWPAVGAVLSQGLSQLVLVAVLFGVGRGIGGVLGTLPLFHPLLPVAVSFLALPLLRFGWDPDRALAAGVTIDDLVHAAQLPAPPPPRTTADSTATVAELLSLPDVCRPDAALTLLNESLDHGEGWSVARSLAAALAGAPATRHATLREAIVLWATDPALFASGSAPGALHAAFAAAGQDYRLLSLLVPRAKALARALPEARDQFPDGMTLRLMARSVEPALGQELEGLAFLLRGSAAPPLPSRAA